MSLARWHRWVGVGFVWAWAGPASADPFTIVAATAMAAGYGYAAAAIAVLGGVYNSAKARRQARKAQAEAKAKALESLSDRTVTVLREDPPWRVVYGEAVTGGDVHDIVTHDKAAKREDGSAYTRPDAYQSVVIVWSDRRCKSVKDIQIEGVSIGAVDASGWVTSAPFMASGEGSRRVLVTGSITLTEAVTEVISAYQSSGGGNTNYVSVTATLSNANKTITITGGTAGVGAWVTYKVSNGQARVRVEHYLGTPGQAASAYLISVGKGKWDASKRFANKCYSIVTLDLEDARFNSLPNITATIEGADEILDPRTGASGYSSNPALCIYDWLRGIWGLGLDADDVDVESVKAAANACDVATAYPNPGGGGTTTGPRYTCNGVFATASAKEAVLADLAESMAGHASYAGVWRLDAGAWTAPVFALTDSSNTGPIEIIQAGEPEDQIFNGVRGQYVAAGTRTPADFDPYQNSAFVLADGEPLWLDITLPFTNSKVRCAQICRVLAERERNGLTIRYPAKFVAWHLQPGDRVTVTNAEYGWVAKTFRVTDWSQSPGAGVLLTLQEDDAGSYDLTDAVTADPTPNTTLPNPLRVAAMPAITCASGSSELLKMGDGTIVPRVRVTWAAISDAYVLAGGVVEARWRNIDSLVWTSWSQTQGADTSILLAGMTERTPILVEARLRNALGVFGPSAYAGHVVVGKLAAPTNAANLIATVSGGQAIIAMDPCPDADYAETEVRVGNTSSTWATATRLGVGSQNVFAWMPYPAVGTYNVFAVHYDSSGNASTPQAIVATVTASGVTSAASGTNLVMNGDFYSRLALDGHPYGWDLMEAGRSNSGGAFGFVNDVTGRDGVGKAAALWASGAVIPTFSAGGTVGILSGSATYPGDLVTGGVSNGWRPGETYTIQYWARRAAVNPGGASGTATISPVSSTTGSGNQQTTFAVTKPAGLAVGDVMTCIICVEDWLQASRTATIGGWTALADKTGTAGNSTRSRFTTLLYRVATAGDVAAASFAVTLANVGWAATYAYTCSAFRGCDQAAPIQSSTAWLTTTAAGATGPATSALTTTGATELVWCAAAVAADCGTINAPSGLTLAGGSLHPWDTMSSAIAYKPQASHGAVGALTGSVTGSAGAYEYDSMLIALKPAATGGGTATGVALWDDMHPYFTPAPASIVRVTVPTPSETWQLYQFRVTWGASVVGNGGVLLGFRMANGGVLPSPTTGDRIAFDDVMVSLGSEFPAFERSPQDDIRALSIVTGALQDEAATALRFNAYPDQTINPQNSYVTAGSRTFTEPGDYELTYSAKFTQTTATPAFTTNLGLTVSTISSGLQFLGYSDQQVTVPPSSPSGSEWASLSVITVRLTGAGPWTLVIGAFGTTTGAFPGSFNVSRISMRDVRIKK